MKKTSIIIVALILGWALTVGFFLWKQNESPVRLAQEDGQEKDLDSFILLVDYDLGFRDLVRAGDPYSDQNLAKKDLPWAHGSFTQENFPPENEHGTKEINVKLYRFHQTIDRAGIIKRMEKDGYRSATTRELLALTKSKKHTDKWVIAPGVTSRIQGDEFMLGVSLTGVSFYSVFGDWRDMGYFLAVKK